jgi:hypothetical protein
MRGGDDHARAGRAGELQREDRNAARSHRQDAVAGLDGPSRNHERMPCRDRGTGQSSAFFIGQGLRECDEPVFVQHRIFREHAVDGRSAERGKARPGPAVDPDLEKRCRHTISGPEACDAVSDRHDFARAVRQRNQILCHRRTGIVAPQHGKIAEIERDSAHTDEHFAAARLGIRPFAAPQSFNPARAFDDFVNLHPFFL